MYEKGLIDPMYSKSPSQQRRGPDLQGGKNGVCYMESTGFLRWCVLVAWANKAWVIHMSSVIWIRDEKGNLVARKNGSIVRQRGRLKTSWRRDVRAEGEGLCVVGKADARRASFGRAVLVSEATACHSRATTSYAICDGDGRYSTVQRNI